MKLEDQVCSLELAKKLKELGVGQVSSYKWYHMMNGEWYLQKPEFQGAISGHHGDYSAFTVAELGEMFPKGIKSEKLESGVFLVTHHELDTHHEYKKGKTEANARAKMLIYLIENNLIKI